MTRQEAYDALLQGKKIFHSYFTEGEYLYLKDGTIFTESGDEWEKYFWHFSWGSEGWSIVPE